MKMKFIPAALLAAAAGVVQADETSGFNLKAGSGITFKSADGTASFRVGGRLQWWAAGRPAPQPRASQQPPIPNQSTSARRFLGAEWALPPGPGLAVAGPP